MQSVDHKPSRSPIAGVEEKRPSEAARRAAAEAEERRRLAGTAGRQAQKEIQGRGGLDPARYGDWEVKGIASDF